MRVRLGAAALAVALQQAPAMAVEIRGADFAERWVAPDAELRVRFARLPDPAEGQLAFLDGAADVSALFRQVLAGEYVYSGRELSLAPGERQIKVVLVKDGNWTELGAFPLKVTTAAGFERASVKPRLDLTVKGQVDQNRTGDAPPFPRTDYQDGVVQGGGAFEAARGGVALSSTLNFTGSSVQAEALRFGTLGEQAPKLDVGDYVVNAQAGRTQLSVGHLSYGNNPLLLMGYGSRGIGVRQELGQRFDVSLNAMNGTSIVGYENFFGLAEADHQVRGGTLGVELLQRKGGLRAELQYLDASLQSLLPFNAGTIPDAEKISGTGIRLVGTTESGRLRADLAFARVNHQAAPDPFLEQGQTLTEIKPVKKDARSLDLAYDLVRPTPGAPTRFPFGLTLLFH